MNFQRFYLPDPDRQHYCSILRRTSCGLTLNVMDAFPSLMNFRCIIRSSGASTIFLQDLRYLREDKKNIIGCLSGRTNKVWIHPPPTRHCWFIFFVPMFPLIKKMLFCFMVTGPTTKKQLFFCMSSLMQVQQKGNIFCYHD